MYCGLGAVAQAGGAGAAALLGGGDDDVLQALDVDLVGAGPPLAGEEVGQHGLCHGVLVCDGALEGGAGEDDHGPEADGGLLAPELVQAPVGLGVEVELEHVENLVAEGADDGQAVGPLLGAAAEDHQGGVVLLAEELERGGILEGVDGVLLGELLGEGLAQGEEVGEGVLGHLGAGGAAQEEAGLGVLLLLGGSLLEGALGAGITGFSERRGKKDCQFSVRFSDGGPVFFFFFSFLSFFFLFFSFGDTVE